MKKINVSFFGTGNIFAKHLKALKKSKKFQLLNLYDIKKKNNLKFNLYDSEKNILNKKNLDIVAILSPSGEHFKQAKKVLLSKKNVIVEKPLALKINHINELIKLEKKYKKKIFVVLQHRLNPAVLKLKKLIEEKKLGKIFLISARLYWCRNDHYYKNNWRGTWKHDGGVVTNQGIHTIDIITSLFGQFKKLFARSNTFSKLIETEDICTVSGELKNKILCSMEFTTSVRPENLENSITVLGDKGYFKILGKNLDEFSSNLEKKNTKINVKDLHHKFYKEISMTLLKNKKNNFSAFSSIKSMNTILGIYQSLKYKREIKFPIKKNMKIKLGN